MQRPYVNFTEIKERVPIPDALAVLGIAEQFERKGDTLSGICPLPAHKHGPRPNPEQFKINRRDGVWLWHCFGDCQKGGDVIELVKQLTGFDNAHVRFWFAEHFGDRLSFGKTNGSKPVQKDTAHVSREENTQAAPHAPSNLPAKRPLLKPLRFRLNLDPTVPYLRERGLTAETIARYGLGLCTRGFLQGYVAIPVHAWPSNGEHPVGYLGRWPGEDLDKERPRYKFPPDFPRDQVIYGLSQALDGTDGKPLIVVEGCFKLYHLVQSGIPHTVAALGSFLSDDQAQLLIQTGRPLVLMFDADAAGLQGMQTAAAKLVSRTFVRTIQLEQDSPLEALSPAELKAILP